MKEVNNYVKESCVILGISILHSVELWQPSPQEVLFSVPSAEHARRRCSSLWVRNRRE